MSGRALICLPLLTAVLGISCGTCNVRPVVNSISPNHAIINGSPFVLLVNGDNFLPGSEVNWNGLFVPTTFVSSHRLTAQISASELSSAGAVIVSVFNPAGSSTFVFGFSWGNGCGGNSNGVTFTIAA